ncbi:MAG: hypothetical protein KGI08_04490 [Thaumarchaeota archaeon]|nr:hypothetical protein [Nitrososphaerota archaeon]
MELYGHKLELSVFLFVAMLFSMMSNVTIAQTPEDAYTNALNIQNQTQGYLEIVSNSEGQKQVLQIPSDRMLFNIVPTYDNQGNQISLSLSLKPELSDLYSHIGLANKSKDIVFIYPSFTQAAYGDHGFYYYYSKQCDASCLTVPIPDKVNGVQASSIIGGLILKLLDYPYVKDQDVDKNPDILKQYKRVIVLHNEYVTQKEFDAITSHKDVVFLYPNALYARVTVNYNNNTITLVHGHGYPNVDIKNGFGWNPDNSRFEYDVSCNDWNFYHKNNYTMLNCYPEYHLLISKEMLLLLQKDDPTTLSDDVANWIMYPQDYNSTENLLEDFDMKGNSIPQWVEKPALWLSNKEISRQEFGDMLTYLSQKQIIQ